jgi:hypothetical protein
MSFLAELNRYLTVRRQLGANLSTDERILRRFATFADHDGVKYVNTGLIMRWLESLSSASPGTRKDVAARPTVIDSWSTLGEGSPPPASIHIAFNDFCHQAGIGPPSRMVLAHARSSARNACGLLTESEGGDSKVARLARATGTYRAKATSERAREACLAIVEEALLELTGKYEGHSSVARAAEYHGIDRRWLRRTALQLIARLLPTCANSQEGREAWVTASVTRLEILHWPSAET